MKKLLISLVITVGITSSLGGISVFAASQTEPDTVSQSVYNAETKIDKNDPLYLSLQEKHTQLKDLRQTQNAVFDSIEAQNQTNKELRQQVRESIKSTSGEGKELKEKLKQASSQIKEIHAQIITLHADVLSIRSSKAAEWIEFNKAIRAADLVDANMHMDNILSYKQQIIDKLNETLAAKKQIEDILKTLL